MYRYLCKFKVSLMSLPFCQSFLVPAISNCYVHDPAWIYLVVVHAVLQSRKKELNIQKDLKKGMTTITYESLVCMNVPGENDVDASFVQQIFHGQPHTFTLTLMCSVGVIPRGVNDSKHPRGLLPVDFVQIRYQPCVLIGTWFIIGVRPQHDHVNSASGRVEGVVEIGIRTALFKWHLPSCIVGSERRFQKRNLLDLMVSLSYHPWLLTREWLD